jgi:hypothetical protein
MSDVPIAVWGDLDAYGIQIVTNLAERLERDITPVAMTADLYTGGTKYKPDDLDDSKRVAKKMTTAGLPALRGLAQAITDADGLGCEQETLYDEVLPTLAEQLRAIEGPRTPISHATKPCSGGSAPSGSTGRPTWRGRRGSGKSTVLARPR